MRYSKMFLPLVFLGLCLLMSACVRQPYDLPDWDFDKTTQRPTAQTTPKTISPHTQAHRQTQPYASTGTIQHTSAAHGLPHLNANRPLATPPSPKGLTKIALLLPLSGGQEKLGQAMLRTAQMALFDVGLPQLEIRPYDTQGTSDGARAAASQAITDETELILGPVFADSVRAAKNVVRYHNVNMISFSTDWSVTSSNVFIMGFLPFDQIERIVQYAAKQGHTRIAAIAPDTKYGRAIVAAYQTFARQYGIETVDILTFDPQNPQLKQKVRLFSRYDSRQKEANTLAKTIQNSQKKGGGKALKKEVQRIKTAMEPPYDAVLIAAGGETAVTISNMLSRYDLPPRKVKRLGIGLFDDTTLANEFAMRDAWFSAPPIQSRAQFDTRYETLYNSKPPRLASLSYDATALAAILAKNGLDHKGRPNFNRTAITNPNGFAGIDGIFRFLKNGTVERGLAVLSFSKDGITEISPASATFQYY